MDFPSLRKTNGTWELFVDGKPYLILGAELHNSSMSSSRYMDEVWQNIKDMGVNTILGSVSWEDIEPEEGCFDFGELHLVLSNARSYGFRVILICYTPTWVKRNPQRFPRMQLRKPPIRLETSNVISIFHEECIKADSQAFSRLMLHLREMDTQRTVIMVQVENEVGLLGDSRDGSVFAEELFRGPVPQELTNFLESDFDVLLPELTRNFPDFPKTVKHIRAAGKVGTWTECFGENIHTDELFMAYYYALYVEKVAMAGKQIYNIPIFTNVWQPKGDDTNPLDNVAAGGDRPGNYPSGGAVSTVLDIWNRFAPTLAFISPDIYSTNYSKTCAAYSHKGQALFIPEQRRDEYGARRVWEALGSYQALGVSPFGIDSIKASECAFTRHYKILGAIRHHILGARPKPESFIGFYFDELGPNGNDPTPPLTKQFGSFTLSISRAFVLGTPGPGFGMIIELDNDRFMLAGMGFKVEFASNEPGPLAYTGILRFEEKSVVDSEVGLLRTDRILNGDETRSGQWANMPNEDPDYGTAFIPITVPARTMIAEVQVYSI
ncbi:family 35 putative beta-galactosidase glycoside hydrolase [Pyrenochaeta sp. MPI-SDFR-AT-0127]|nr:family 35 putative beta-galactosidase glycoside hydrolase [Pyrenochaeta sp. MPI-SDFR-AT-0127]